MKNIKINIDILDKANDILTKKEEEKKLKKNTKIYIKKCIKARICPICGEPLLKKNPTKEEKRQSFFDVIEYVLYCKKSKFIHIEGWNDNYNYNYDDYY
jgi:hypothetical protein